jgi:hypothetical protein
MRSIPVSASHVTAHRSQAQESVNDTGVLARAVISARGQYVLRAICQAVEDATAQLFLATLV